MLNWIAIYVGEWLFGDGGLLQNSADKSVPVSNDIAASAKLPVFWGTQQLQGLHIGFFIAIAALVVFYLDPQPHDTRIRGPRGRLQPGGGCLRRHQRPEESHPGDGDLRCVRRSRRSSRHDRLPLPLRPDRHPPQHVGFLGIAVALLGRNTAVGVGLASLLFGGLLYGTTHGLSSNVIQPELAGNLTYIIQGLIVLFVGADLLILSVWNARRKLRPKPQSDGGAGVTQWSEALANPVSTRLRNPATTGYAALAIGVFAAFLAIPPITGAHDRLVDRRRHRRVRPRASGRTRRGRRRLGVGAVVTGLARDRPRHSRHPLGRREPERGLRRVAGRADVRVRDATRVRRDRRDVLGAQRRREHRPRGNDADGRVLGRLGC